MLLADEFAFALRDGGEDVLGGLRRVEKLDEVRAVGKDRKAREDVEVLFVVSGADEEEVARRAAVGRTEEDRTLAAPVCDEALLEDVRVVVPRMQERDARANGGGGAARNQRLLAAARGGGHSL